MTEDGDIEDEFIENSRNVENVELFRSDRTTSTYDISMHELMERAAIF